MPTHVALLRGVNVGGRNKVAMSELRRVVSSLGHADVTTYIQSGNVIFTAGDPARPISGLADQFGGRHCRPAWGSAGGGCRLAQGIEEVIRRNPFADEHNPKAVHAVSRARHRPRSAGAIAAAVKRAKAKGGPDEARVVGGTLYLWTPDGLGRSQLAAELCVVGEREQLATGPQLPSWRSCWTIEGARPPMGPRPSPCGASSGYSHNDDRRRDMGAIRVHESPASTVVIDGPTWTFGFGFDPRMGQAIAQSHGRLRGHPVGSPYL